MPIIGVVLNPGSTRAQVGELHKQLSELGAVVAPAEQNAKKFGATTAAAVRAFRQQYGLQAGNSVDLSPGQTPYQTKMSVGWGLGCGSFVTLTYDEW